MKDSAYKGESVLWLRFVGGDLNNKALPIYELGETFVAIQRILNKAYLFHEKRLSRGSQVSKQERIKLALQIIEHNKSSDVYGLGLFLSHPLVTGIIGGLIANVLVELAKYAGRRIILRSSTSHNATINEGTTVFTGSIYNQVSVIVDRIDNIGGVEKIIISPTKGINAQEVIIDRSVRDYVWSIRNKPVVGEIEDIEGRLLKLDIERNTVLIQRKPGDYVNVHLNTDDFNTIRYKAETENIVSFTGNPIYILGKETSKFSEFSAIRIKGIRADKE
jgi:hypothetical protein